MQDEWQSGSDTLKNFSSHLQTGLWTDNCSEQLLCRLNHRMKTLNIRCTSEWLFYTTVMNLGEGSGCVWLLYVTF
jgi:hypothetical protein